MRDTKGRFIKGEPSEKKNGKILECRLCKKQVYVPKYRLKTFGFCSTICSSKFNYEKLAPKMASGRIPHQGDCHCFKCKPMRGQDHYNWQGGKQKHGDGYMLIYKPDHPTADKRHRIMEHRYVMELHLGRALTDDEHVHHINGNKLDNRIENLMMLSNSEHLKHEWEHGINMKNSMKAWIKKGQHLSPSTEFKKL